MLPMLPLPLLVSEVESGPVVDEEIMSVLVISFADVVDGETVVVTKIGSIHTILFNKNYLID